MTPREGPTLRVAHGALPPGAASAPAAYFIKDSPTEVLRPSSDDMEARVHFGALASSGPSLDALEQLIKHVFMPLLGANGDGADAEETGGARRRYAAAKEKGGAGAPRRVPPSPPKKENVTPNVEISASSVRTTVLPPAIAAELASDAGQFGAHVRRAARRLDIADAGSPVQIVRGDAPYAAVVEYGRLPQAPDPGPGIHVTR